LLISGCGRATGSVVRGRSDRGIGAVPESGPERRKKAHEVREQIEKGRRKRPNERKPVREPRAAIL
jgi:hypothetical protein